MVREPPCGPLYTIVIRSSRTLQTRAADDGLMVNPSSPPYVTSSPRPNGHYLQSVHLPYTCRTLCTFD